METDRRLALTRRAVRTWAAVALAGMAAAAWLLSHYPPDRFAIYPVCPLQWLTGWLCPLCGATRAAAALGAGNWPAAWHSNPLIVVLAPASGVWLVVALVRGRWLRVPWPRWATAAVAVGAVAVTFWRNILR